jgi:hypothetical protein
LRAFTAKIPPAREGGPEGQLVLGIEPCDAIVAMRAFRVAEFK